jgi:dsDNA-specific endonuclease/ATPase MutS2
MLDTKKARASIKDLKMDRVKIKGRDDQIRAAGEKLAGDKDQLDKMRAFVESMDMPAEEKTRTLAHFEQQQKTLEKTFEVDVEQTTAQEAQQLNSLQKEASDYANSAAQNKEKLDGFRKQSGMDDSAIKKAAQEQGRSVIDYREEQDQILEEKAALEGSVANLKRRVTA